MGHHGIEEPLLTFSFFAILFLCGKSDTLDQMCSPKGISNQSSESKESNPSHVGSDT